MRWKSSWSKWVLIQRTPGLRRSLVLLRRRLALLSRVVQSTHCPFQPSCRPECKSNLTFFNSLHVLGRVSGCHNSISRIKADPVENHVTNFPESISELSVQHSQEGL